jgi:hypothetical protein
MSIVSRRAAHPAALRSRGGARRASDRPTLARRAVRRVVVGPHEWGELDVWSSRYGYTGYCLAVFPPGSTTSERIRFRLLRSWPPIGVLVGLAVLIVAAQRLPFELALLPAAATYLAGWAALAVLAGARRTQIRTLRAGRDQYGTIPDDGGAHEELEACADVLQEAERLHREGAVDAVGFEVAWGAVWDRLAPAPRGRTGRRPIR